MKTTEQRFTECANIRAQLQQYLEDDSVVKELIDDMNHFVRDGTTATKSIYVPELGRTLKYMLSTRQDSYAVIKSRPDLS
jgi:hypothetical protein